MEINNFFTFENIILASTGLVNLVLLTVIGLRNEKSRNTYFFLYFILSVMSWVIGVLFFRVLEGENLLLVTRLVYFSATLIPFFIILFTQTFPNRNLGFSKNKTLIFLLFPVLFLTLTLIPGAVIKNVYVLNDYRAIVFGPFYYFYALYIITYFLIGIGLIIKRYFTLRGIEKNQIEIIFLSILVSSFVGVTTNLIMPSLNIFSLFWVGPFFSGYMVLTIAYAMIRYGLFNIKLIATEFATISTWVLMIVKLTLESTRTGKIIDSIILFILIISGIYVIKNVTKEIKLREKDDKLVNDMVNLNKKLEKTNLRLKELDQKKSEFMSLATHQLRAPLTAMRGYTSMILDGTLGKINNIEVEDAIEKISRSTTDLVMIVEDYLNISRIEQGRMQYNFSIVNISDLLENIIKEVKVSVDKAGLSMNIYYDKNKEFNVNIDEGKIKQVLFNIIDNAIKYTPKGSVDIFIDQIDNGNKVLVKIKDTGVGIKPEILPTLFNKFTRAPDANKTNILGTGLGLYVANQIIKAHNGRAWAESKGEGKGSEFYVELALVK